MAKYLAHGTTVTIASIPIGGLVSISLPSSTRGEAEVTDSDSGYWREFIAGMRDPGEMSLTMRHDPDDPGQAALESNFEAPGGSEIVEFVITLPDVATAGSGGRTYTFDGYVMQRVGGDLALADDEAAEVTAQIRLAGAVTVTS